METPPDVPFEMIIFIMVGKRSYVLREAFVTIALRKTAGWDLPNAAGLGALDSYI
jgi:hypothetical protein